jgi:peptide/nickel transport system permease protein
MMRILSGRYRKRGEGENKYEIPEDPSARKSAKLIEEMGDEYYVASQWTLMRRKFAKHRLAKIGGLVMIILAVLAIFCEFFSPYDILTRHMDFIYAPPQRVHIFDNGRLAWPFVYEITAELDMETLLTDFTEDVSRKHPVKFFYRGEPYKFLGLISTRVRFFGVDHPATVFLFGTDHLGRDLFSRILFAARISMSVGLVGVAISFILGCLLGGISGYYGGAVDMVIQRIIEFLNNIPRIPLWMALSAALPPDWPVVNVYFGITLILSIIGWTGLARVVRGKLLANRELDYILAAKIAGNSQLRIIRRHLLPSFISHLIVSLTLAIPGMILGETSLSFLGIGMRPPAVSWGVLLQNAQNIRTVALYPWLMIPGIFVVVFVLAFNFLGDGLRDAADPYK